MIRWGPLKLLFVAMSLVSLNIIVLGGSLGINNVVFSYAPSWFYYYFFAPLYYLVKSLSKLILILVDARIFALSLRIIYGPRPYTLKPPKVLNCNDHLIKAICLIDKVIFLILYRILDRSDGIDFRVSIWLLTAVFLDVTRLNILVALYFIKSGRYLKLFNSIDAHLSWYCDGKLILIERGFNTLLNMKRGATLPTEKIVEFRLVRREGVPKKHYEAPIHQEGTSIHYLQATSNIKPKNGRVVGEVFSSPIPKLIIPGAENPGLIGHSRQPLEASNSPKIIAVPELEVLSKSIEYCDNNKIEYQYYADHFIDKKYRDSFLFVSDLKVNAPDVFDGLIDASTDVFKER